MKHDVNAIIIIPAKTDSTRLKRKNLQVINGLTLLEHTINYALRSKYVKEIWVNTESEDVKKIAKKFDLKILQRRPELMGKAEVVDVYLASMPTILKETKLASISHVVGLQPDHPDRTRDLDEMLDYFIDNTYDDLFTVDSKGTRNGSVRIFKAEYLISGHVSKRVGSMLDNCTNIHDESDLKKAEKNIETSGVLTL